MGKAPGVCGGKGGSQHLCKGNFYSNGVLGSIVPVATGHRARGEAEGHGRGLDGVPRRRHARRGRDLRVAEHRLALAACRCSSSSRTTTTRSRRRSSSSSPARSRRAARRSASRSTSSTRPTSSVIHEAAGRAVARIRETGAPFFLVLNTYRFSPHSKSDDQRDPAEIEERRTRDPLLVAGASARRRGARGDRGAVRGAAGGDGRGGRRSTGRSSRSRRVTTTAQGKRGVQALNETLHALFAERDDVVLFGEDVLDPYGGAFKVTQGLSRRVPGSRAHDADQRGLALRRRRREWRFAASGRSSRSCSATSSRSGSTRS